MTFEAAMDRLDGIVKALESPDTPLEESLRLFGEGSRLLAFCSGKLADARVQVEKLLPETKETGEVRGDAD